MSKHWVKSVDLQTGQYRAKPPSEEGVTTIPKGSRAKRLEAPSSGQWSDDDMVSSAQECAAALKGGWEYSELLTKKRHPYAAVGAVVLGAFLLFGASFFVTQFVGG